MFNKKKTDCIRERERHLLYEYWIKQRGKEVTIIRGPLKGSRGRIISFNYQSGEVKLSNSSSVWVIYDDLLTTIDNHSNRFSINSLSACWVKHLGKQVVGKSLFGNKVKGELTAVSVTQGRIFGSERKSYKWVDLHTLSLYSESSCCH